MTKYLSKYGIVLFVFFHNLCQGIVIPSVSTTPKRSLIKEVSPSHTDIQNPTPRTEYLDLIAPTSIPVEADIKAIVIDAFSKSNLDDSVKNSEQILRKEALKERRSAPMGTILAIVLGTFFGGILIFTLYAFCVWKVGNCWLWH